MYDIREMNDKEWRALEYAEQGKIIGPYCNGSGIMVVKSKLHVQCVIVGMHDRRGVGREHFKSIDESYADLMAQVDKLDLQSS